MARDENEHACFQIEKVTRNERWCIHSQVTSIDIYIKSSCSCKEAAILQHCVSTAAKSVGLL